jgi:hypothetical protein
MGCISHRHPPTLCPMTRAWSQKRLLAAPAAYSPRSTPGGDPGPLKCLPA